MTDAIDLFAGAGGFTLAAERAGCRVLWAANHWPAAVAAHAANHPHVEHTCQDLQQANWSKVPRHGLLLAAPQCTGHAHVRGLERPHHDAARSTAWAVCSASEALRPPVVIVENVPEFRLWDSREPHERPRHLTRGNMFECWCATMAALGYSRAEHILDAADFGVPQHRRRLFLVFARSRAPLVLRLEKSPRRPARDFARFDLGTWKPVRLPGRAAATMARFNEGRAEHGPQFILPYYGTARGGRSLDEPIGTITTSANHHALVDGDRIRMLVIDEIRAAMGFPESYQLPSQRTLAAHLLGNAVAPACGEEVIRAALEAA